MKYVVIIIIVLVVGLLLLNAQDTNEANNPATENTSATSENENGDATESESDAGSSEEADDEAGLEVEADADVSVESSDGEVKEFSLDGFNYGYSEDEIRVNEGDTVTINFTSSEGFHDWVVDEFDAATEQVSAGETTSVTFVADEAGTYEFYCSVGQHRANGMVGTLVVE